MDRKPSTMSAATQRFTENGRPDVRRFFSAVIVSDYATVDGQRCGCRCNWQGVGRKSIVGAATLVQQKRWRARRPLRHGVTLAMRVGRTMMSDRKIPITRPTPLGVRAVQPCPDGVWWSPSAVNCRTASCRNKNDDECRDNHSAEVGKLFGTN